MTTTAFYCQDRHHNNHQKDSMPAYFNNNNDLFKKSFTTDHIDEYNRRLRGTLFEEQIVEDIAVLESSRKTRRNGVYCNSYSELNKPIQENIDSDNTTTKTINKEYKKKVYKALDTARLRKASSLIHNIIVESAYENMVDADELQHGSNHIRQDSGNSSMDSSAISSLDEDEEIGAGRKNQNRRSSHGNQNGGDDTYETRRNSHNEDGYRRRDSGNNKNRTRINREKKLYRLRKHHSDYDIVHLQVEEDQSINDKQQKSSLQSRTVSDPHLLENEAGNHSDEDYADETRGKRRNFSKSETNLYSSRKSSSHVDITSTQMYKDIYADNLRQYGFLLAKQLGISKRSPDQLRKTYIQGRKKALERRERANTTSREHLDIVTSRDQSFTSSSMENINESIPRRKFSSQSNLSQMSSSQSNLTDTRTNHSLTDISNIVLLERHRKPTTTVIRRKKGSKLPRDATKRLSAPLMDTLNFDVKTVPTLKYDTMPCQSTKQRTSLSVPNLFIGPVSSSDDSGNEHVHDLEEKEQKTSNESTKRKNEAKAKYEYRMSRLKSFDNVLFKANTYMKDIRNRKQNPDQNSKSDGQNVKVPDQIDEYKLEIPDQNGNTEQHHTKQADESRTEKDKINIVVS